MSRDDGGAALATAGGALAVVLWSGTVALSRSAAEALGPVTAAAAVCTVGGVLSLVPPVVSGARRRRLRDLPGRYLGVCGALFVGYLLLLFLAVGGAADRLQVLTVGLLNYLWPPLTILLSLPLLGRRARPLLWPATALALVGIVLVVAGPGEVSWGALARAVGAAPAVHAMAAAAAVAWALYSNLARRWAGGRPDGGVAVFLPAAALVLLAVAALRGEPRAWTPRAAAEVVLLGAATWAGYSLWDAAMRRGHAVPVAAVSYLTPLLSTAASCLYLGVVPGPRLWLGCALLVAGSLLSGRAVAEPEAARVWSRQGDRAEPRPGEDPRP